jgi:hypothetical protein
VSHLDNPRDVLRVFRSEIADFGARGVWSVVNGVPNGVYQPMQSFRSKDGELDADSEKSMPRIYWNRQVNVKKNDWVHITRIIDGVNIIRITDVSVASNPDGSKTIMTAKGVSFDVEDVPAEVRALF